MNAAPVSPHWLGWWPDGWPRAGAPVPGAVGAVHVACAACGAAWRLHGGPTPPVGWVCGPCRVGRRTGGDRGRRHGG